MLPAPSLPAAVYPPFSSLSMRGPSEIRGLLLIRLFQQATTGSMNECLGRDFPKACGSFNRRLLRRKLANSTWPPAVGRMASCVRNVETDAHMNWRTSDDGSVPDAGTRFL